eukprot:Colp12_sorted_trinity150504_noHs@17336
MQKNLPFRSNMNRGANSSNVAAVQWSALYHITLRALCETHQYPQVLRVLRRMKAAGVEQGTLSPQIPTAIALLGALWSPINPLQEQSSLDSGSAVQKSALTAEDPVQQAVQVRRQLAASLRSGVTDAVTALAVPVVKDTVQEIDAPPSSNSEHNGTTANTLAREYVLLLCKLDLLEDCKLFINDVQTHVLNVRYGRPNRHSPAGTDFSVETATVGAEKPVLALTKVAGFWNNNWMAAYFRRAREQNTFDDAETLYSELEAAVQFDDAVRRKQHGGDVREKDASRKVNHMYHDTAAALRASGEIGKLADLMSTQRL